ncbi:hypothetical protein D9613_009790 [Agrocybe pediades]|uniref:Uncharacterized protein n=1 Tax=Agrocybe pediades TaxID=84607 RepID=A0A8H4QWN0_9AGAR|nr:hypothetical protein D9613_009790 [Agrocybe pediades]
MAAVERCLSLNLKLSRISSMQCIRILQWDIVTVFLAMWLTEAVLIIRLYALYNRSRIFLAFMLVCYAASTSYTVWILAQDIEIATLSIAISIPGPGGVTCTFPGLARKAYTFFIPFAAFDSLLCAFAVYRGYLSFRSSPEGLHGSPVNRLLKVMTRDSIFNYVILSLSYIAGTVIWVRLPAAYIEIPSVFIATLCYILATRMVLNIRDTASTQRYESTNPTSNPTIEFAAFSLTGRQSEVLDTVLAPEP